MNIEILLLSLSIEPNRLLSLVLRLRGNPTGCKASDIDLPLEMPAEELDVFTPGTRFT